MPLYEYRCPTCRSTFELLRPMKVADRLARCPQGHAGGERVVSLIARPARGMDGAADSGDACACGGSCRCS